jgi:BirA family biotin operon repressor/biotin-[acetyl-CoA-carboxylase] ligase
VAVVDAIRAAAGASGIAGLRLKWPNDVLIGTSKCAGILAETQTGVAGSEVTVVVGIGINLAWHPHDLARRATHLAQHGVDVSPDAMLPLLAAAWQHQQEQWALGAGFSHIRSAWLARSGSVGENVSVDLGKERLTGTFLDLDEEGALVLGSADGRSRTITYGDVTLCAAEDGS